MGIFANLKLRRKLLFAMAPLAMMAILAAVFSSIEIRTLDDWYSQLVDRDWRAVHHIDIARALNMRYGFYRHWTRSRDLQKTGSAHERSCGRQQRGR